MSFKFSYSKMVDWYEANKDNEDLFANDEKMVAFFITPSKKYEEVSKKWARKKGLPPMSNKKGWIQAFVKRHVPISEIRQIKFIKQINPHYYPNGLYYVKEDNKHVYFVFPNEKTNLAGQSMLLADHFSLPYKKDAQKQVQLHATFYTPTAADINIGQIVHEPKCHFEDGTVLPSQGPSHVFDNMLIFKDDILCICRTYNTQPITIEGGSGGVRNIQKRKKSNRYGLTMSLEHKLLRNGVMKLIAFGFFDGHRWNVMCRLERAKDNADDCDVAFVIDNANMKDFTHALERAMDKDVFVGPV
jgi:hypothetical protein